MKLPMLPNVLFDAFPEDEVSIEVRKFRKYNYCKSIIVPFFTLTKFSLVLKKSKIDHQNVYIYTAKIPH